MLVGNRSANINKKQNKEGHVENRICQTQLLIPETASCDVDFKLCFLTALF